MLFFPHELACYSPHPPALRCQPRQGAGVVQRGPGDQRGVPGPQPQAQAVEHQLGIGVLSNFLSHRLFSRRCFFGVFFTSGLFFGGVFPQTVLFLSACCCGFCLFLLLFVFFFPGGTGPSVGIVSAFLWVSSIYLGNCLNLSD